MSISTSTTTTVVGTFDFDVRLCGEGHRTIIAIDQESGPGGCNILPFTPLWFSDTDSGSMEWHKDVTTRRDMHQWLLTYSLTYGERVDPRRDIRQGMVIIRATDTWGTRSPAEHSPVAPTCVLVDRWSVGEHGLDVYGWQCSIENRQLVAHRKDLESVYFWFNDSDTYWTMPLLRTPESQPETPAVDDEVTRLNVRIAELERQVTTLTNQRDGAIAAHEADGQVIGSRLLSEADRRGWCEEFDTIVEDMNTSLTRPLALREREYEFHIEADDLEIEVPVSNGTLSGDVDVTFSVSFYVTRTIVGNPSTVEIGDLNVDAGDFSYYDIQVDDVKDFEVVDYEALRRYVYDNYGFDDSDFSVESYESA